MHNYYKAELITETYLNECDLISIQGVYDITFEFVKDKLDKNECFKLPNDELYNKIKNIDKYIRLVYRRYEICVYENCAVHHHGSDKEYIYKDDDYSYEILLYAMKDIRFLQKAISERRDQIKLDESVIKQFYDEIELIKKEFNIKTEISFEDAFKMLTTSSEQIRKENNEILKAFSCKDNFEEVSLKDVVLQQ